MSDLFRKTTLQLMMEACKSEGCKSEGCKSEADVDGDFDELEDEVESCKEYAEDIEYGADYVPVLALESDGIPIYAVELDNLNKYMESAEIDDIREALENVAECNDLSMGDIYLMIEDADTISEAIQEAKCSKKLSSKKIKSSAGLEFFQDLKNKKVKVIKKKSKSKRRKKKRC